MKNILRIRDVCRQTGHAKSTIYELMQAGAFPKPIKLGPRQVGWIEDEVDAWITARIAERDARAA